MANHNGRQYRANWFNAKYMFALRFFLFRICKYSMICKKKSDALKIFRECVLKEGLNRALRERVLSGLWAAGLQRECNAPRMYASVMT